MFRDQSYPLDERHWLMGTTYNTGIECLQFVTQLRQPVLLTFMPSFQRIVT